VQASQTIAAYWLPAHLVRFHAQWPDVVLRLAIGNTAQVARAVHEGEAAVGFVEGAVHDPALAATVVARDRLLVVVASGHALAGRARLGPADLSSTPWVMRERGSGTRSEFEAAMVRLGAEPDLLAVALELPSNESVRAAVEAGAGAAALSELVVAESIAAGRLVALPVDLSARFFSTLVHRCRYRSRAVQALLDLIGHAGDSIADADARLLS
jgi:DNA-binding transcriptional LysR family regulator